MRTLLEFRRVLFRSLPRKYGGRSGTPQPRGFSLRPLLSWRPTLCPNQNYAATAPAPLELRRGAEKVRVDFDAEDLTGSDRDRLRLERGERIGDARDEKHRRGKIVRLTTLYFSLSPSC